ncbi:S8 family serine peptidase, partial [Arthrospira platensis SPKY2]
PFAEVNTFDWGQDAAEVIQEITSNGLLLSNHSYGIRASTSPTWFAGAYSNQARIWDVIMYNAPYYLMVTAAGNEGMFTNPDALALGLDKLTGNKNTKNNLVVANALDANVNPNGQLVSVQINMASSQGPTDDFRIKPDITGNGTFVFSSTSQTDSSYGSFSGTSMASPNVMGSL